MIRHPSDPPPEAELRSHPLHLLPGKSTQDEIKSSCLHGAIDYIRTARRNIYSRHNMRAGFHQYIYIYIYIHIYYRSNVRNKIDLYLLQGICWYARSPINIACAYHKFTTREPHVMEDSFPWCRSELAAAGDSLASMHRFLGTQRRRFRICSSCADRLDQLCRGSMVACHSRFQGR